MTVHEDQYRTFKAETALAKNIFVKVKGNDPDEVTVELATTVSESVGTTAAEAFSAGDRIAVILYDRTRIGVSSAAIVTGAIVDVTAAGKLVTAAGAGNFVALSPASGADEEIEVAKTEGK